VLYLVAAAVVIFSISVVDAMISLDVVQAFIH